MAKAIMIQGTTSGAGKSFLVAALCRLLRQDQAREIRNRAFEEKKGELLYEL